MLFNPGVGHPNLAEGWVPALEAIKASGRPLLVTGHSEMDSRRDLTALEARYGHYASRRRRVRIRSGRESLSWTPRTRRT